MGQRLGELQGAEAAARSELARLGAERADLEGRLAALGSSLEAAAAEAARQAAAAEEARARHEALRAQVAALEPHRLAFLGEARALLGGRFGVEVAEDRVVLETDDLYRGRATLELTEDGRALLRGVALALGAAVRGMPEGLAWAVRVEGHTDDVPLTGRSAFATNRALAAARAAAAAEYLARQGVPGERVWAVGMGEYRPRAADPTDEARRRNRRLEIALVAPR
jgi:chemotaxis protein MotB